MPRSRKLSIFVLVALTGSLIGLSIAHAAGYWYGQDIYNGCTTDLYAHAGIIHDPTTVEWADAQNDEYALCASQVGARARRCNFVMYPTYSCPAVTNWDYDSTFAWASFSYPAFDFGLGQYTTYAGGWSPTVESGQVAP